MKGDELLEWGWWCLECGVRNVSHIDDMYWMCLGCEVDHQPVFDEIDLTFEGEPAPRHYVKLEKVELK